MNQLKTYPDIINFEIWSVFSSFDCDIRRPLPRISKIGIKSSVCPLGQQMMYENIGFQGQGIQIWNQITKINDNHAHVAPCEHKPLCRNGEIGIKF